MFLYLLEESTRLGKERLGLVNETTLDSMQGMGRFYHHHKNLKKATAVYEEVLNALQEVGADILDIYIFHDIYIEIKDELAEVKAELKQVNKKGRNKDNKKELRKRNSFRKSSSTTPSAVQRKHSLRGGNIGRNNDGKDKQKKKISNPKS